jgi:hypothetical protein
MRAYALKSRINAVMLAKRGVQVAREYEWESDLKNIDVLWYFSGSPQGLQSTAKPC